jgi:5-(carboxyamino)imidazole ribonucleotide synthase
MIKNAARIGIVGGGQLGRMLSLAAARLGVTTHIYSPEKNAPAFQVTPFQTCAAYEDEVALTAFARGCDVITYEFENIPVATVAYLNSITPVYPARNALEVTQDKLDDLTQAVHFCGAPSILKTRRFGYDGKGQVKITDARTETLEKAWQDVQSQPCILEAFIPFVSELSVIIARGLDGSTAAYEPSRNIHENHILKRSILPAGLLGDTMDKAKEQARQIAQKLDYCGILSVEFFLGPDQSLIINELAPRVHNSGHWTMDAAITCQFEQHIRAILGLPLGNPARTLDVTMVNLLGEEALALTPFLTDPQACLHLYGKGDPRPGRKMGHVNLLAIEK